MQTINIEEKKMKYDFGKTIKLDLLRKGINLGLYGEAVNPISSRVTSCNGLFLEYSVGAENYGVKVRINPNSELYLINRDKKTMLIDKQGNILTNEILIKRSNIESSIFSEQLSGILAASLYGCELANLGKQCKFCASSPYEGPKFSGEKFRAELDRIKSLRPISLLTLNAGSRINEPYRGYESMRDYVRIARQLGINGLNLELMPSVDLSNAEIIRLMNLMQNDGVTSVQFNIEIWDKTKRQKQMPFKGQIPIRVYLNYISRGALILGKGKVSSVLLIGLNTDDELLEGSTEIIDHGGIPSLEVFRPLPGTELESFKQNFDLEQILNTTQKINGMIVKKYGENLLVEGCLKCKGCSI